MALGWALGAAPHARLTAGGTDRWNDRVVLTGPISVEQDRQGKFYPVEALYVLNYSNGLLLAAVPRLEGSTAGRKTFSDFAERDLVKDFGIEPGTNPHFLMSTVNCGVRAQGWAPLVVIETETGQVATYQVQPQTIGATDQPRFLLLDRRTDARLARAIAASATADAR